MRKRIKKKLNKLRECKVCGNEWTTKEGYNVKKKLCPGCIEWEENWAKRQADFKERTKMRGVNFPYVAGDPFW